MSAAPPMRSARPDLSPAAKVLTSISRPLNTKSCGKSHWTLPALHRRCAGQWQQTVAEKQQFTR